MTSDMIQNKYTDRDHKAPITGVNRQLELTRDPSFVEGTQDIFDILARAHTAETGWEETFGESVNFFERIRSMLQRAEKTITEQDETLKALEKASGMDALTGLLNAGGFSRALTREIARTNRGYNEGGLLVMFCLENLQKIREAHGEEAANTALRLVAQALELEIRDMDLAARAQDDEFVLLFTDTTMGDALERLQNMALRLNRLSLIWHGAEIRISLSLGLKSYEQGAQAEQIFKDASADLKRNRKGTHPRT